MSSNKGSRMHSDDKNPAKRYTEESLTEYFDRLGGVEDPLPDMEDDTLKLIMKIKENFSCKFNDDQSSTSTIKNAQVIKIGYSGNDSKFLVITFRKREYDKAFRVPKNFSGDDEALDQLQRKIKENWFKAFQAIFKCIDRSTGFPGQKPITPKDKKNSKGGENATGRATRGIARRGRNVPTLSRVCNCSCLCSCLPSPAGQEDTDYMKNFNISGKELKLTGGENATGRATRGIARRGRNVRTLPRVCMCTDLRSPAGQEDTDYMKNLNISGKELKLTGGENATGRATRGIARRGRNVPTLPRVCKCTDLRSPAGQEDTDYMKNLNISGKELKLTGSKKNQ